MAGVDTNLSRFFRGLDDPTAYNSMLIGYDSTITAFQSSDQGTYSLGIVKQYPVQTSSGDTALQGIAASLQSLNQFFSSGTSGQGYTATARAAGASWTTAGGASPQNATEYVIASGVARTACTATDQASVASVAGLAAFMPAINDVRSTTRQIMGVLGGDFSRGVDTTARVILRTFSSTPNDMRLIGLRQLPTNGTISTANSAWVNATTLTGMSGAGVKAGDVSCGTGLGTPYGVLVNPTSTTTGTAYAFGVLGCRILAGTPSAPAPGLHVASIATGGHTVSQWASCLGLSGTGTTPNPYMSSADAQEYIRLLCGLGTGRDFPNKIVIWDGHNPTTNVATPGNDEATEFSAGVITQGVTNRVNLINHLNSMADALSSPRPDILFVCTPMHQNGYSGTFRQTWYRCLQTVAQLTGQSVLDLHVRTTPLSINQSGATPYNAVTPSWCKTEQVNSIAGTTLGPVAATNDWLHPSVEGSIYMGRLFWDALFLANGKQPGIAFVGSRQKIYTTQGGGPRVR